MVIVGAIKSEWTDTNDRNTGLSADGQYPNHWWRRGSWCVTGVTQALTAIISTPMTLRWYLTIEAKLRVITTSAVNMLSPIFQRIPVCQTTCCKCRHEGTDNVYECMQLSTIAQSESWFRPFPELPSGSAFSTGPMGRPWRFNPIGRVRLTFSTWPNISARPVGSGWTEPGSYPTQVHIFSPHVPISPRKMGKLPSFALHSFTRTCREGLIVYSTGISTNLPKQTSKDPGNALTYPAANYYWFLTATLGYYIKSQQSRSAWEPGSGVSAFRMEFQASLIQFYKCLATCNVELLTRYNAMQSDCWRQYVEA